MPEVEGTRAGLTQATPWTGQEQHQQLQHLETSGKGTRWGHRCSRTLQKAAHKGPEEHTGQLHAFSWGRPNVMGPHTLGHLGRRATIRGSGAVPTPECPARRVPGGKDGCRPCIPALPLWDHQFSPIGIPSHQTGRQAHTFLSRCSEKGSLHCRAPLPIMPATIPRPTAQGLALKSLICTYKNATSDQTRAAAFPLPCPSHPPPHHPGTTLSPRTPALAHLWDLVSPSPQLPCMIWS